MFGGMKDKVADSFAGSPVLDLHGYPYFVHPLTDGVPRMDPALLREVLEWIGSVADLDCDVIAAPESMGIPLAVPLSLERGIPYVVIRKRRYGLPGETPVEQRTGYSEAEMYVDDIRPGERVLLVDDVVSTGGTLIALIKAIRDGIGAKLTDVVVPVDKGDGKANVERETGVRVKTMLRVSVGKDGKVSCARE